MNDEKEYTSLEEIFGILNKENDNFVLDLNSARDYRAIETMNK